MYKNLSIEASYNTIDNDIVEDFYNPVLIETVQYDRVSGYFSSKALAAYAKGLSGLVSNNGKFRLIISSSISEEDFELIKEGYSLREEVRDELLERLNENPLNPEEKMNLHNLAHLIALGYVDIKIGFVKVGIFHSKYGVCKDNEGDIIYFSGSNNETYSAIVHNYESFDVTTTWQSSEFDQKKIFKAQKHFELLWNDKFQLNNIFIKEINDVVKNKIMTYDRGKIIVDKDTLTLDALILTTKDGQLILQDNLQGFQVNPNDFILSKKLQRYYATIYPFFKSDLTYVDMQRVIAALEKYANKNNFRFIVGKNLLDYIDKYTYWIEERSEYGTLIKNRDIRVITDYKKFEAIVSEELQRPLREQQMWSAFYMHQMKKTANFSVPGSGKTSMIYGVFAYLNSPSINKVDKIVMIGPKNSFQSWKLEFIENFGTEKQLKVLDVHAEESADIQIRLNGSSKNLILVNYESLQRYEGPLLDIIDEKTILVFDEIHKIKGITSKRASFAKSISKKPIYKFALTGTPIPNSYQDIYNFLNILYMEEYKMFFNFQPNELKNPDSNMAGKINQKIYPFFWRTTKKQLAVPEPNKDKIIKCSMTIEEQEIINLLYKKYGHSPFYLYIRLIQASTNPELLLKTIDIQELFGEESTDDWYGNFTNENITFSQEEVNTIRQVRKTTKYIEALQLTEKLQLESKQVIIWCMFVNTIDSVYTDLLSKGVNAVIIYGSTPQHERDVIIEKFKRKEIDVLITNPHTLAESVSLHKNCHDAIYLEYSFNLTHMLQSRDRIHRLGLPDGQYTQYYYFMLESDNELRNSIDEKIYLRLKEKEQLMLDAIEGELLVPEPSDNINEILSLFKI